jgi:hypothetical protein
MTIWCCIAEGGFVLPTVQYLAHHMRCLVPPDKSLFFSGPRDYEFTAWMYAKEHDLHVLVDFMDPTMTEEATNVGGPVLKEYWCCMSQAYSEVTTRKANITVHLAQ